MAIWKVEAVDDCIYVSAGALEDAEERVRVLYGKIPRDLLNFTEVEEEEVPEEEEIL